MSTVLKEKLKDCIVQYRGGGYDGCFWEWNFAYFDNDGEFHDIHSSGRAGCKCCQDLLEHLNDEYEKDHNYIYDVNSDDEMLDFTENTQEGLVISVAKTLANDHNVFIDAKCECCQEMVNADEMENTGAEGCGGIAIQNTGKVCSDCYSIYSCAYCGEFYGDEYKEWNDEGYCEYCQESSIE